jgi:hypothetical protein
VLIGAEVRFRGINEEEQEAYAFLELDGGSLELIQKLDADYEKPVIAPPYCPHLALETKDMNRTLDVIRDGSINIVRGPLEIAGEERWVYVADPDHNIIEFIEWISR